MKYILVCIKRLVCQCLDELWCASNIEFILVSSHRTALLATHLCPVLHQTLCIASCRHIHGCKSYVYSFCKHSGGYRPQRPCRQGRTRAKQEKAVAPRQTAPDYGRSKHKLTNGHAGTVCCTCPNIPLQLHRNSKALVVRAPALVIHSLIIRGRKTVCSG